MCQITIDRIIVSILLLDPVADKERSWIMQSKCQVTLVLTLAASE